MNDEPSGEQHRSSFIAHRLLAIRLSAFGDVIHTLPAVVALRDAGHQIAWAVERPYRELVELVAGVETIPLSMKRWMRHPGEIREARRHLRGFEATIDFQGLLKSATIALLSGAKKRYGFARDVIREKAASLFINRPVKIDDGKHVVEWNVDLARGIDPSITDVPTVDFSKFVEWSADVPSARVILLPGAGKPTKMWPITHFRHLAHLLGDDVLVAWGPGERELAESIDPRKMAPPTNLRQLALSLHRAQVVIGADTGPLHLAAALGTKVIGLYGPTNPIRNGPYGQVENCLRSTTRRMDAISVEDVMRKMNEVLRAVC